jgi:hypothetical protein
LDWFADFRKELFAIIKAIGGTEIIFLPDQSSDKLCHYFELFYENITYEEIKTKMMIEFKNPIKDYKMLDYEKLNYKTVNEFFLDDFEDLIGNLGFRI